MKAPCRRSGHETKSQVADNAGNGNQQRKPSTSRPSSPPTAARRASRSPWTSGATTSTRTRSASSGSACARTSGSGSPTRASSFACASRVSYLCSTARRWRRRRSMASARASSTRGSRASATACSASGPGARATGRPSRARARRRAWTSAVCFGVRQYFCVLEHTPLPRARRGVVCGSAAPPEASPRGRRAWGSAG